jgi:hypothetical protein
MDDRTEHLRDVFREVTGEEVATEHQTARRGSLLQDDDTEQLRDAVAEMREYFGFETDLDDATLCTVVELFYGGAADAAIADALGVDERTVFRARTDLHLLRDDDADPRLLAAVRQGADTGARAEADGPGTGDVEASGDPDALERARQVAAAQSEASRVSDRFRLSFEDVLAAAGLRDHLTADARADGLREAAEDIETNLEM